MNKRVSRAVGILFVFVFMAGLVPTLFASAQPLQQATNLALNKPVVCSSVEFPCAEAVDGNIGTRWSSAAGVDPQWIYVDLGSTQSITSVILRWETAYATAFQIQTSPDATNWTNIYSTTTGTGGVQTLAVSGSGRYVRLNGTARATQWGYSLWEFEVYGGAAAPTPTKTVGASSTATRTATAGAATATSTRTNTAVGPTATFTRTPTQIVGASPTATATTAAGCSAANFALGKTTTASSVNGTNTANLTVDGNVTGSRWESVHGVDPQWLQIDLGATQSICRVILRWEGAYASGYQIQTSNDATNWTNIYTTTTGDGGMDDLTVSGSGRYIRMNGTVRATTWGYSLWEMEVYTGSSGPTATLTRTNTAAAATSTATRTLTPAGPTATFTRTPTSSGGCSSNNIAINRPITTSSSVSPNTANLAVDALSGTRWESVQGVDPQWLQLDFGSTATFCRIILNWEVAAASAYQIQTSADGSNWTNIYTTTTSGGGLQDFAVSGSGRYLRLNGTARTTTYGYSLWELEVYGSGGSAIPTVTPVPTWANPIDLGPNVAIFDPSMSSAVIQAKLDEVLAAQASNQFGNRRDALLFKPGTYSVSASIGFNTQISGLGFSPDDVVINGLVNAEADWFGDNGTQNFWRAAENMKVNPTGGTNRWAVSQAAPFRRMHIAGNLQLDPRNHGWSSGGFIADTLVDGQISSGSQQQYLTRNSQIGSWAGSNWNMVFVGVTGAPAQSFPSPAYTTIAQTPLVREKPFLYVNGSNQYFVFVPGMRTNVSGTTWSGQTPAGTSLPISQFYIVKPGATAADINTALAAGKDLLVTPGVYHLNQTINITRANTVVLGLGMATFINDGGIVAMKIADVDGVKVAGLLFDAGTTNATTLLEVGPAGSSASHAANPTQLSDVFVRVGGAVAGKVNIGVTVNSSDVIIDHTWIWRGDHGAGIGWNVNTSDNGLVVNGANVTVYGLFVEHFQKYNVVWNANGGRVYFFQNELPYDPPNQAAYMNGSLRGWAAYKVANTVTTHEAWGVGSYCYFNVDPTIVNDHGFEVPNTAGVKFHDLLTISLGNNGSIINIINNVGAITPTNSTTSTWLNYP